MYLKTSNILAQTARLPKVLSAFLQTNIEKAPLGAFYNSYFNSLTSNASLCLLLLDIDDFILDDSRRHLNVHDRPFLLT